LNAASFAGWSGEIPITSNFASASLSRAALKSTASIVQPGVIAAGKKYTMTRLPA